MAIPEKPLEVTVDPDLLTVGDLEIFDASAGFSIVAVREFLERHTNWSRDELRALTMAEFKDVMAQVGTALQASAVPLASSKP